MSFSLSPRHFFPDSGGSRTAGRKRYLRKGERLSSRLPLTRFHPSGLTASGTLPQHYLPPTKKTKWPQGRPVTLLPSSAPVSGLHKPRSEPAEGAEWPPPRHRRHSPVIYHGLCVPSFTRRVLAEIIRRFLLPSCCGLDRLRVGLRSDCESL